MKLLPFIPYRRRRKDRELPKAARALCVAFLLLQTSALFGQAGYVKAVDTATITVSGRTFTHQNTIAELNITVEYVITGSPTITSIIVNGCMRGGTCQALSTYTGSSSTSVSITGLYDSYTVTPTWTGGSSPAVTINWLATSNSSPGSSAPADPCQSNSVVKSSVFKSITTATTTEFVPLSGTTRVYICGYTIGFSGTTTANTLFFEYGTGGSCASGPTQFSMTHRGSGAAANTMNFMSVGYAGQSVLNPTPAGTALCAVTTVATSPNIDVQVSYVQQ